MNENGYTYPVLMDETGELFRSVWNFGLPTTFMIDREGNVYGYVTGQMTEGHYAEHYRPDSERAVKDLRKEHPGNNGIKRKHADRL